MEESADLGATDRREDANPTGLTPADTEAFLELYNKHYSRLQFYLMAIAPTANDAADILQETSLVLWRSFLSFESGTNFYAWACKIARLQTLKYRQKHRRAARLFGDELLEMLVDEAGDESRAPQIPLDVLESCLQQLTEYDRSLIRKRYQPDASVKDIAVELGRTANSLSKSLGRIRRMLLDCIQRKLRCATA